MNSTLESIISDIASSTFSALFFLFVLILFATIVLKIDDTGWVRKNITHRKRKKKNRDPQRTYTKETKAVFSRICMNRCEGGFLIFRCQNKNNLQGDHWYPHANGGATTTKNLVMLCRKCNGSKSNKIPSVLSTISLSMRRMIHPDYEARITSQAGQWYPRWDTEKRIIAMRKHGDLEKTMIGKMSRKNEE